MQSEIALNYIRFLQFTKWRVVRAQSLPCIGIASTWWGEYSWGGGALRPGKMGFQNACVWARSPGLISHLWLPHAGRKEPRWKILPKISEDTCVPFALLLSNPRAGQPQHGASPCTLVRICVDVWPHREEQGHQRLWQEVDPGAGAAFSMAEWAGAGQPWEFPWQKGSIAGCRTALPRNSLALCWE